MRYINPRTHSLTLSLWARRWINHWSLWRMASARPDLRLPSQPQSITAPWLVPNYTAWWQRHMCVNNLPKVVTWKCKAASRTHDLQSRKSHGLTTASDNNDTALTAYETSSQSNVANGRITKRYCHMTNCKMLRWLVKTPSRDVRHYWMISASRSTMYHSIK